MKTIFLDIETIPTQNLAMQQYLIDGIKAPANYKDEDKIAAYIEEAKEEVLNKNSFDGSSNHIVCIAVAVDGAEPLSCCIGDLSQEKNLLQWLNQIVAQATNGYEPIRFVGHNISSFDLKIIRQKAIVLGVQMHSAFPFAAKPWELNPYDTMIQWDAKNYIKLDRLALALGIEQKKLMSGADVYPSWVAGEHEKIAEYCRSDVALVREVYRKMVQE